MKKILLACGTGICTSTAAANKLKGELEKRGKLNLVQLDQCKVAEAPTKCEGYDLLIATTQVPSTIKIPVVMGLPFLTGVGMDKAVDEVLEKLGI